MPSKRIIIGGETYTVAPLKTLQVASFFDSMPADGVVETKTVILKRSLLNIGLGLRNAGGALWIKDDASDDQVIEAVNEKIAFSEVDPAFTVVLEVTGLTQKGARPGEADAVDSTSSESTAVLSAA